MTISYRDPIPAPGFRPACPGAQLATRAPVGWTQVQTAAGPAYLRASDTTLAMLWEWRDADGRRWRRVGVRTPGPAPDASRVAAVARDFCGAARPLRMGRVESEGGHVWAYFRRRLDGTFVADCRADAVSIDDFWAGRWRDASRGSSPRKRRRVPVTAGWERTRFSASDVFARPDGLCAVVAEADDGRPLLGAAHMTRFPTRDEAALVWAHFGVPDGRFRVNPPDTRALMTGGHPFTVSLVEGEGGGRGFLERGGDPDDDFLAYALLGGAALNPGRDDESFARLVRSTCAVATSAPSRDSTTRAARQALSAFVAGALCREDLEAARDSLGQKAQGTWPPTTADAASAAALEAACATALGNVDEAARAGLAASFAATLGAPGAPDAAGLAALARAELWPEVYGPGISPVAGALAHGDVTAGGPVRDPKAFVS